MPDIFLRHVMLLPICHAATHADIASMSLCCCLPCRHAAYTLCQVCHVLCHDALLMPGRCQARRCCFATIYHALQYVTIRVYFFRYARWPYCLRHAFFCCHCLIAPFTFRQPPVSMLFCLLLLMLLMLCRAAYAYAPLLSPMLTPYAALFDIICLC